MRTLRFIALDTLNDPADLHAPALVDKQIVWNALISTLKPNLIYNTKTKHLTRSRTLEIINLCATATARRLYGN
jgi:hypothetical protein